MNNNRTERKNRLLCIGIAASYLIMIGLNAAANIFRFNGITTGEVSDSYPNLFAPAGITFSIWGVIYILLIVYIIYSIKILWDTKVQGTQCRNVYLENTAFYFMLSSVANAIWMITWHYRLLFASVILMSFILWCLYSINKSAVRVYGNCCLKNKEQLIIRLPFGIYFGWITVAFVANITTLLVSYGFDGGSYERYITVGVLLLAAGIAFLIIYKQSNVFYGPAVIWAYLGILNKHISKNGFAARYPDIIITVIICLAVLIGIEVLTLRRIQKSVKNPKI